MTRRHTHSLHGLALVLFFAACAPQTSPRRASNDASRPPVATPAAPHIRFEHAADGELAPLVRSFAVRARAEGRIPLVYVGATWCEPCRYFHAAAERGELDAVLPSLALYELDLDRDGARIAEAGYRSQMIPLFVVPGDDGRSTGRQIEGSIHGPGSPAQITPRLRAILEPAAPSAVTPAVKPSGS
jgi:thiol-disulfide isomerase/thioredoxin